MSWIYFRDQALQDIKSVRTLYTSKDYGNSAYLLQQSIEKLVKSIVIRYDLSSKPMSTLGHMPLTQLWDDLYQRLEESIEKSSNKKAKNDFQNMSKSIKIIKDFFKDSTRKYKFTLWKDSLKIPISEKEELELLELIKKLKHELEPQIRLMSHDFTELFENKIKPFLNSMPHSKKQEIQNLLGSTQLDIDLDKLEKISISNINDIDEFVKSTPVFFNKIEKLYQISRKGRGLSFSDSELGLTILFAWLFSYSIQILKVFPHESIGRYPTLICVENKERSSRNWYKDQKKILKELQDEVIAACEKLDLIIFDKIPKI